MSGERNRRNSTTKTKEEEEQREMISIPAIKRTNNDGHNVRCHHQTLDLKINTRHAYCMFVMASFGGQLLTTNVVAFDFDPRGCWFACFCSFLPFFFAANRATQSYYFPPFSPRPAQKFEFPASFLGSDEVFHRGLSRLKVFLTVDYRLKTTFSR